MNNDAAFMVGMIFGSAMVFSYLFENWPLLFTVVLVWAIWMAYLFGAFA